MSFVRKTAARNRRTNHMVTAFGRTQCIAAWVEESGLPYHTVRVRLKLGWNTEDAVSLPVGANRFGRTVILPLTFADLVSDPTVLKQFRARERVPLLCSTCGIPFDKLREALTPSDLKRSGVFCSRSCAGKFGRQSQLETVDSVVGRHCINCGIWKPLIKFGESRVCYTCRNSMPKVRYHEYIRHDKHGFGLTFDEFMKFWQQPCWYCGCSITTIGIDRIDNAQGHVMGNCVSCCARCNRMKSKFSQEDFLDQCRRIVAQHSNTENIRDA